MIEISDISSGNIIELTPPNNLSKATLPPHHAVGFQFFSHLTPGSRLRTIVLRRGWPALTRLHAEATLCRPLTWASVSGFACAVTGQYPLAIGSQQFLLQRRTPLRAWRRTHVVRCEECAALITKIALGRKMKNSRCSLSSLAADAAKLSFINYNRTN